MIGSNSNTKKDKGILDDTSQIKSNIDEDESEMEEEEEEYESSEQMDDLSDSEEEFRARQRQSLSMDTKIVISANFEKEIYLHVLAHTISLYSEDDSKDDNHFDPKLERMVDLYEMVILLCQGICLPSLLKVLSGEDISEYPNSIKLPVDNKSYEMVQSCTAILSGDYEYFLKTHRTFLDALGMNTKANSNNLQKVLKCILLVKGNITKNNN